MRCFRSAFSLVELSIVLAILGVLTAGGLSIGTSVVEQQANVASNAQLDSIHQAMQDYFKINRRLPCPANRTLALGATGFGTEAGVCNTGAALTGTVSVGGVRIGALPVRAIGLRDRSIADEFGNRYIYAVTERHTNDVDFLSTTPIYQGMITLIDGSGNAIASGGTNSGVSYIVISTGNDGKGALRYQNAAAAVACGASANLDVQNCNDDATFRDARFNNGSVAASFFDDFVRWLPKFRMSALTNSGGGASSLWSNTGDNIYSVGNDGSTTTGNVGIGNTQAPNLLTVGANAGTSSQTNAAISVRAYSTQNSVEWGDQSPAGYGSTLGYFRGDGQPFIALNGEGGTNNNTFRSRGIRSSIIITNNAGGLQFGNVANANADNQAFAATVTLLANGNLGIGTTTPTDLLTVNGNVLATNYFISSDARLKHAIHPAFANTAMEIVAGIKPVHFTWNKDDKNDIGVIAQDVEKVMPEAVSEDDKGFKRVAYDKLVLPVIEAVKELHKMLLTLLARTKELEEKVTTLEKDNEALKKRIETLESLGKTKGAQ